MPQKEKERIDKLRKDKWMEITTRKPRYQYTELDKKAIFLANVIPGKSKKNKKKRKCSRLGESPTNSPRLLYL